ncbi:MAG: hypothetical protein VKK97_10120, partial [Synechococcaceae cyanobacterium]|nr:hypothetical protein [Synechococcaceae cyanobacterium]
MDLVHRRWNAWAQREGIPCRSEASLRRKALELGLSVVPDGQWVAVSIVRRHLERSQPCLYGWAEKGWIVHRPGAVLRSSLVRLARQRPHLFAGCPADGLLALLRDPALVDALVMAYPKARAVPRRSQRVECLTTGQV